MTGFHLSIKPSLRLSVDEAAITYQLPDLNSTITAFFANEGAHFHDHQLRIDKLQIWHKVHIQLVSYHNADIVLPPQTLHAIPPSTVNLYGQYDLVIISPNRESSWPKDGLAGHSVAQLWMIFRFPRSDFFFASCMSSISTWSPTPIPPMLIRQPVCIC